MDDDALEYEDGSFAGDENDDDGRVTLCDMMPRFLQILADAGFDTAGGVIRNKDGMSGWDYLVKVGRIRVGS